MRIFFCKIIGFSMMFPLWAGPGPKKDYRIVPVPFTAVNVADNFWGPRIETNRTVTIPANFEQCEKTGRIDNFMVAGKLKPGKFVGYRYNDSDVYKIVEAAAYSLRVHPDPKLEAYLDKLISYISAAQEPDGYLYTTRTIDPRHPVNNAGQERWSFLEQSHELYNVGHMYEAAVAHFQATGKRSFLNVALKSADLVCQVFGPGKGQHPGVPGHEEIEIGLVKLYRVSGNEKYLRQAKYFLEQRGRSERRKLYSYGGNIAYAQDHIPVVDISEAEGHAVRALYLYSGMADVAALTGYQPFLKALDRVWANVIGKKLYLTGGVGATGDSEAFGANYELPNLTAYSETCAAVANIFWNQRMFLLHGDAKYIDLLELTLYNAMLAGVSLSGDRFFYDNPLASCSNHERSDWFDCSCCPPNVARLLASISGYIYAVKNRDLYVNLFIGSDGHLQVAGQKVHLLQETAYPWQGAMKLTIDPEKKTAFALHLRIPGWAQGRPLASDLYTFLETQDPPQIKVNGQALPLKLEQGYAIVERSWQKGDQVELQLPMPVHRVKAHAKVGADLGHLALMRGPLVYCAEGTDNQGQVSNLILESKGSIAAEFRQDLLSGVQTLKGKARLLQTDSILGTRLIDTTFTAIPYFAWAQRGKTEMITWFTTEPDLLPAPTVSQAPFGTGKNGKAVDLFTISNRQGMKVQITNFGGKIVSLLVPDRTGRLADVVLGYGTYPEWEKGNPYFGALIGRYGNRIAKGKFSIAGREYSLAANNGPNALHGGPENGFHNVLWQANAIKTDDSAGVELNYTAQDGEEGYPGRLQVTVTYTLNNRNELTIDYYARSDKATPVNLTHHSFFNLRGAGNGDILEHKLTILANAYTPVDATLIPTGEIIPVAGTPFDFRSAHAIGERIVANDIQLQFGKGYDHNFVLNQGIGLRLAAIVDEPESGRQMEVLTTEPGLQFYSGNFLDGSEKGKGGAVYGLRSAFCLEAQHFPNSPNQANFPNTILQPGQTYQQKTVYRFLTDKNQ